MCMETRLTACFFFLLVVLLNMDGLMLTLTREDAGFE